jgi:hypothetical protein
MAIIPLTTTPWSSPEPGFWAGSTGGTYLGCVESFGERFRARDAQGAWLGDYPSLQLASSIIEGVTGRLPVS